MCQAELFLASRTEALSQVVAVALPVRHHHGIVANGMVRLSVFGEKCMVYSPTCGLIFMVNVGKYTIHGSSGIYLFIFTLPETNSSHPKMDGWNTIVSLWDGLFSGAMLNFGGVNQVGKKTCFFSQK